MSIKVEKAIPIQIDLQCLTGFDLDSTSLPEIRDSCQAMINALFAQEIVSDESGVFALLPPSNRKLLPREKPIPKPKPMTRWEKFASKKGIQKRKKIRVQYDKERDEYRPTFGYKNQGSKEKDLSNWITEEGEEDKSKVKKENILKNQKQQKRNLEERLKTSKTATASVGKFDKQIKGDVKVKKGKQAHPEFMRPVDEERKDQMSVLSKMQKGGVEINQRKAIKSLKK